MMRYQQSAQPRRFRLCERRGWDSNPRVTLTTTAGFQDSSDSALGGRLRVVGDHLGNFERHPIGSPQR
jgi:hypothetical protein